MLDDVPKKPMSEAGASSNAPDASASTLMASPSLTARPLWPAFKSLPIFTDDALNSEPWVILPVSEGRCSLS